MKQNFYLSLWKWFYPGMRVKRFLLIVLLGIIVMAVGLVFIFDLSSFIWIKDYLKRWFESHHLTLRFSGVLLIVIGSTLVILGISNINRSILKRIAPRQIDQIPDIIYLKRKLGKGPRITVIGGGTGLNTLLRGLKQFTSNIRAIVTVFDSGGSSGQLRKEMGVLPPGDIRNCLVALSSKESLMTRLFDYRFREGNLKGHSFGNLLITAMSEVSGDFYKAIEESSEILAIRGAVLPSTMHKVILCAKTQQQRIIRGEANISLSKEPIEDIFLEPSLVLPLPESIKALHEADVILLGPGSLYTSILCNLLIKQVSETICNSKALKMYICNVMTQPGETNHFTASMHLKQVIRYLHHNCIDYTLVNSEKMSEKIIQKYDQTDSYRVKDDLTGIFEGRTKIIRAGLLSEQYYARHDSYKLARLIMNIINKEIG